MEKHFERGERMVYILLVILGFVFGILASKIDHDRKTAAGTLVVYTSDESNEPFLGLRINPEYATSIQNMDTIFLVVEREHIALD